MTTSPATEDHPIRIDVTEGVGVLTLHRPESRNAINPAMRRALWTSIEKFEANPDVSVMILTGTDPAFCAGLDLKLLGADPSSLSQTGRSESAPSVSSSPFPERTKPLIGAINGPAITGGFELALNCDFLIASPQAAFADTHARVGVMPGWGLTALLGDAVGRTRAREISLTGNFVSADEALQWGLVNRVVPHGELLTTTMAIAADIAGNDQLGVAQMLATYASQERAALDKMWQLESDGATAFARVATPGSEIAARRQAITERGRSQI